MDERRSPLNAATLAWLALLPAGFLAWFFFYPVARILWLGLSGGSGGLLDSAATSGLLGVAAFTVGQAVLSTVLTLLVGIPIAGVMARFRFPFKRTIRTLVTVPFVLPTVVVGAAFLAVLGPRGVLGVDLEGTFAAILIAHVFYNVAVVVRVVGALWETLDPRMGEAAKMLGAGPIARFRDITLPLIRPAILAAAALVFLFTFTSFGVILILGGLEFETIEVAIYNRALLAFDLRGAAILSMVQLIGVGATLAWYSRYQRSQQLQRATTDPIHTSRPPASTREKLSVAGAVAAILVFSAGPMLMLVWRSVTTPDGLTFSFYRQLAERDRAFAVPPFEAIGNSLRFALVAAVIAVIVGGMAAIVVAYGTGGFSRGFDALLMLPLGTSAVTVGFGFLVALDRPIDLRASIWLVPIAHALVAVPFVVRTSVPVMASIQHRLREAASMLGASPSQVFREIDVPLVTRALLVGAAFAFAISLGEFGATAFIARPDNPTLPIAIERFLSRPGASNFGQAMAMASVLMGVTGFSVAFIGRWRGRGGI